MNDKQTIFLVGLKQKQFAHQCIDRAPADFMCQIKPKTRKEIQSGRFHAMCGDVARQLKYMGRTLTKDQWKVLFISGHAIATGLGAASCLGWKESLPISGKARRRCL